MKEEIAALQSRLAEAGYIAERQITTVLYLAQSLQRPLLIEGEAGVGKTDVARVFAQIQQTELIRLQCYDGLDVHAALYEWNYPQQILRIRMEEQRAIDPNRPDRPDRIDQIEQRIFSRDCLLERPLLKAITQKGRSPVLLIDEVDRADERFEAFLLELLSDFQVTIPELGTIRAEQIPTVILTSNRTRDLSDALRRRCLYLWIDPPGFEKEVAILRSRIPDISRQLSDEIGHFMQRIRTRRLYKSPGIAETLDWARALIQLHIDHLDPEGVEETLGCVLKDYHDMKAFDTEGTKRLLAEVEKALQ
jgi:MoxR-like ATPase